MLGWGRLIAQSRSLPEIQGMSIVQDNENTSSLEGRAQERQRTRRARAKPWFPVAFMPAFTPSVYTLFFSSVSSNTGQATAPLHSLDNFSIVYFSRWTDNLI